jgi:hypothetical protein
MILTHPFTTMVVGVAFGWAIRYASAKDRIIRAVSRADKEIKYLNEAAAEGHKTNETINVLAAADADTDLDVLACLDTGQVEDAKKFLVWKLGLFYHKWTTRPKSEVVPESIERSLSRVRDAAKTFGSVRAVLAYRPGNGKPVA